MLSVIIPVGEGRERNLNLVLFALTRQVYEDFEVVIVYDGKVPIDLDLARYAKRLSTNLVWRQFAQAVNLGAFNRNIGARVAQSDLLVFLDSDVVLCPQALGFYADAFRKFPRRAIAGPYHWLPPMLVREDDLVNRWSEFIRGVLCSDFLFDLRSAAKHNIGPDRRACWGKGVSVDDLYCDYPKCLMLLSGNLAVHRTCFRAAGGFWEKLTHGIDGAFGCAYLESGHVFSFEERAVGYHLYHERNLKAIRQDITPLLMDRFHSDGSWLGQMKRDWGWPWRGEMR